MGDVRRADRRRVLETPLACGPGQRRDGAGFDPGGADGLFSPRRRTAIRNWQAACGTGATGRRAGVRLVAQPDAGGAVPLADRGGKEPGGCWVSRRLRQPGLG